MAGGLSRGAGFGLGALAGLIVSGSLAAILSLTSQVDEGGAPAPQAAAPATPAPAPAAETEEVAVAPTPAPTPQTAPEPAPQAEPEAAANPAPAPEPAPQAEPAPQPSPEPAPAPTPAPEPESEAETATPAPAAPAPVIAGLPPVKANAEIYNGDRSQPLLSIVLVSSGDASELDELLLLPGPLTVVVAPNAEAPQSVVRDLRDAGFEALLGIDGAVAGADEAATAERVTARTTGVEGLIGLAALDASLSDAAASAGIAQALERGGFGLLDATQTGGGGPFRAARALDLPAAANGRNFDDAPSSALVFQALERAAFDARRTGAFVVVATVSDPVVTGLRRWMNIKAGKSVDVAPLSVVMEKIQRQ